MTRRPTLIAAAAAVLLFPGLLTGCSSQTGDSGADRGAGGAPTAATERAGEIGSCMREKGYAFDDSELSGGGVDLAPPEGVDAQQYIQDLGTCSGVETSGAGSGAGASQTPEELAFSGCIRDNGFDDYPDGQDARSKYHPADEAAFAEVETTCATEAYGDQSEPQKAGPQ